MITDLLFTFQDLKFKNFNSKLIPNISSDSVIGVKVPTIRKLAKTLVKSNSYQDFINSLPHKYLEENILHGCIISLCKEIDITFDMLDNFLPYVDNWCVCDTISCNVFKSDYKKSLKYIKKCLKSKNIYTVRFGIVSLLKYFLDDEFTDEINNLVLNIKSDEYYINMAIAWYFSFALIKQYDKTVYILENRLLDKWVHNKTISKCIDSYRLNNDVKSYLKTLIIK